MKRFFSVLLVLLMALLPGFQLTGKTQALPVPSLVGVLLPDNQTETSTSPFVAKALTTLNQGTLQYSIVHLQDLTNFKGKLLVLPVDETTSQAFLDGYVAHNPSDCHTVLLPMNTQPSQVLEHFFKILGLQVIGGTTVPKSLALYVNDQASSPYLSPGSFVWNVTAKNSPLAMWGSQAPAAVVSNKTLLVNWNWQTPLPVATWNQLLDLWQLQDSSLSLAPVPPADKIDVASYFQALQPSRIQPVLTEDPMYTSNASPVMIALDTNPQKQTENNHIALIPLPLPHSDHSEATPQAKPAQDSNPDAMYDFDGANNVTIDRATLENRRSVESQDAVAAFYNDRMRELADMEALVNTMISQSPADKDLLNKALIESGHQKSRFETAWFNKNYAVALPAYEKAKTALMNVLFAQIPPSQVEGRAIWLDRGSIVRAGNAEGLKALIQKIGQAGFNIIYFETVNAGYPIYPSALVEQNPQVKGWDPLQVAVDEAHRDGMELHAWVWTFAVGNTRHNQLLGQSNSYPGPILSKPELASEALRGRNGELVLPEQYEYWLSPASVKARKFLISYFSEIVRNYKVDGLQLDYIRYPFQKPNTPSGFEPFELGRFTAETGLTLSAANEDSFKVWEAWKAFQVTSFVRDLSQELKTINPDLKLSAAVFPLARHSRMLMIQQDWEAWVRSGWIDTLSPMAYSRSARSLDRLVEYIHNVGGDKTLVYPGLSLSKLNAVQLLDTLEICRNSGVMGTTLFAFTQLDPDKQLLLESGPYKQRQAVPPHRNPVSASIQVISETKNAVDSLLTHEDNLQNHQVLYDMQATLKALSDNLVSIKQTDVNSSAYMLGTLKDQAAQLAQQTEQWSKTSDPESLEAFQAKELKLMVEKVVRMVNYTAFQLSSKPKADIAKR